MLAACSIVASAIGLAVIYGMVPYLNPDEVPRINDFSRVTYGSFHRIGWAAFVIWIIFTCFHGYGGAYLHFPSIFVIITFDKTGLLCDQT